MFQKKFILKFCLNAYQWKYHHGEREISLLCMFGKILYV